MRALLLPVDDEWYAVDVRSVREVIARPVVTRVPTAPSPLLGLFNLRGEIVPLFDTATLLGLGPMAVGPFAAIVETPAGQAGLSVSGLPEWVDLDEATPIETGAGAAIYAFGARQATQVDVGRLLLTGLQADR